MEMSQLRRERSSTKMPFRELAANNGVSGFYGSRVSSPKPSWN